MQPDTSGFSCARCLETFGQPLSLVHHSCNVSGHLADDWQLAYVSIQGRGEMTCSSGPWPLCKTRG
jgi:hypothetical protein